MKQAARELNFVYEPDDTPHEIVQTITHAICGRTTRDEQYGIFLSHFQQNAGPEMMELKGQLERSHPDLKEIWYDKDNNPSIEGMRTGVKRNRYFIAYLTKDYLIRPFCRKEIRWAIAYHKTIIVLWKREGDGAVGRFQDFFDQCEIEVGGDNGGSDMKEIFNDAAINYYPRGEFHSASMAELADRLGYSTESASQHLCLPRTISIWNICM